MMRTNPITFTIYKISYLMRNIFNLFNEMIFFTQLTLINISFTEEVLSVKKKLKTYSGLVGRDFLGTNCVE